MSKHYSANFAGHASMLAGHASVLTCSTTGCIVLTIAVEVLGMLHYSLTPSQCIQVDIERLLFSLAVKLYNFQGCESSPFQLISLFLKILLCQNFSFFFHFQPIFWHFYPISCCFSLFLVCGLSHL